MGQVHSWLIPIVLSEGDVAQLVERLPCTQEVIGSNPFISTMYFVLVIISVFFEMFVDLKSLSKDREKFLTEYLKFVAN